ncbi:hypothetical protein [Paracoccus sp. (in: a-proteobacteria)]|uniref:hypothetical protein n=1 Tax=Paracoccus sp. TaxID=267 RepID=UPI00396C2D9E
MHDQASFEEQMDHKYGAQREPIENTFIWHWLALFAVARALFYGAIGVAIAKAVMPGACAGFATECAAAVAGVTR